MKRRAARAAVAAAFFALCGVAGAQGGTAASVAASAASASAASQPAAPVVGQYSVHPGQSLHDIAVDLTQSHDKGLLANVSQALFDANPNAFAKHDPSRLKIGSVLNVPGVPGVVAGASGVTAASAPAAAASSVAVAAAPASSANVAPASAPAVSAAASAPAVAAAGASSAATVASAAPASAVSSASTPSATAASAAVAASGTGAEAAAAQAAALAASGASASVAASQPAAANPASDSHVWSGAIQAAPAASAASGAASAQGASSAQAPVPVSSLQQLLELKNRVLMALQKHGIGKPAQTAGASSGVVANGPAAQGSNGATTAAANPAQPEISPVLLGIAAAIGAALLALIARLLMRKPKKPVGAADEVAPVAASEAAEPPVLDTPLREAPVASAEPPQPDETLDHATDAASLSAAASLGGEALPPASFESAHDHPAYDDGRAASHDYQAEHDLTAHGVEPGEPQTLADAGEAASFAAAAELGASALPPEGFAARPAEGEAEELARAAEEPALPEPAAQEPESPPQHDDALPAQSVAEPPHVHAPAQPEEVPPLDLGVAPGAVPEPELHLPQHLEENASIPESPAIAAEDANHAAVPPEFPQDAVSALGGIDMGLPPRVAEPADSAAASTEPIASHPPLSTEPVNSPETTAAQAMPFDEPPAPPAGQAIEAGTAGHGAIAGLGAPRFGALSLDFDLDLPPDSAEPLPVFTPGQLARIARNKLDLAHEYIALGDLAGARSLIHEVIESNDHATRTDAQALLSTLAPLS